MSNEQPNTLFEDQPMAQAEKAKETVGANALRFSGADYQPGRDRARLTGQILRVYQALQGGAWLTLPELHKQTGDPVASISAQLRNLRKSDFGGHTVLKRRRGASEQGLYEYRLFGGESGQQGAA